MEKALIVFFLVVTMINQSCLNLGALNKLQQTELSNRERETLAKQVCCTKCGSMNDKYALVCENCNASLNINPKKISCPKCTFLNFNHALKCEICFSSLERKHNSISVYSKPITRENETHQKEQKIFSQEKNYGLNYEDYKRVLMGNNESTLNICTFCKKSYQDDVLKCTECLQNTYTTKFLFKTLLHEFFDLLNYLKYQSIKHEDLKNGMTRIKAKINKLWKLNKKHKVITNTQSQLLKIKMYKHLFEVALKRHNIPLIAVYIARYVEDINFVIESFITHRVNIKYIADYVERVSDYMTKSDYEHMGQYVIKLVNQQQVVGRIREEIYFDRLIRFFWEKAEGVFCCEDLKSMMDDSRFVHIKDKLKELYDNQCKYTDYYLKWKFSE